MKTSEKIFATGMAFLFLFLFSQLSCSTQSRIKHYSGDGEIQKVDEHSVFIKDGYTIQFKAVKLDHSYHLTHHLNKIPKIDSEVYISYAIQEPEKWMWAEYNEWHAHHRTNVTSRTGRPKMLKGIITMCLKDSKGTVILQQRCKLSEFGWFCDDSKTWQLLYVLQDKGRFSVDDKAKYILGVSIEDVDPILKNNEFYVTIKNLGKTRFGLDKIMGQAKPKPNSANPWRV